MERSQRFDIDKISEKLDANGYLRVSGFAARTGVLQYNDTSEYVSPGELFNNDSLKTLIGVPVTASHPSDGVNTDNAMGIMAGSVVAAGADGDRLKVKMVIHDEATIGLIRSGVKELSCGYNCEVTKKDGVVDGQNFDSVQSNRIYNHLAIVKYGRAGSACSIKLDQGEPMEIKELEAKLDEATKLNVELQSKLDASDELDKIKEIQVKLDAVTAENETLKADAVSTDLESLLAVVESAKVLKADSAAIVDGKLLSEVEVMTAAVGQKADGKSEDELRGYFYAAIDFKKDSDDKSLEVNKRADAVKYVSAREKFISGVK